MRKKKKDTFDAAKAVKSVARDVIGSPRPTRRAPDKPRDGEKYKPRLTDLLEERR